MTNPTTTTTDLLTPEEVCNILHISRTTLRQYVDTGKVARIRLSHKVVRFERGEVLRLIEASRETGRE